MDPAEVEFVAEKQIIKIKPNFTQDRIYLICGEFGPFKPGLDTKVPLWLAVNLKHRQKCKIIPPFWMNEEYLTEKKQEEIDLKFFTEMPDSHYMEIAQILLKNAPENINNTDAVRTLIKDIWDLRIAKLRSSICSFVKSDSTHAKLNHLTLMELNTVRPFLTNSLDHLTTLRRNVTIASTAMSSLTTQD